MFRFWATALLFAALATPAHAVFTPLYAGVVLDNTSVTGLLGYQINKSWGTEAHTTRYSETIAQAGATNETRLYMFGISALYMVPTKLRGSLPYFVFAKAGYERALKEVSYSFPASVTYSGSYSHYENRLRLGLGAQYDLYEHVSGRAGVDISGDVRSVYLSAIIKF